MRSNDELNKPWHEFLGLNKSSEVGEEKRRSSERQGYPSSSSTTKALRPLLLPGKAYQIFKEALNMLKSTFPLYFLPLNDCYFTLFTFCFTFPLNLHLCKLVLKGTALPKSIWAKLDSA